jgi:hypothetical protein
VALIKDTVSCWREGKVFRQIAITFKGLGRLAAGSVLADNA